MVIFGQSLFLLLLCFQLMFIMLIFFIVGYMFTIPTVATEQEIIATNLSSNCTELFLKLLLQDIIGAFLRRLKLYHN